MLLKNIKKNIYVVVLDYMKIIMQFILQQLISKYNKFKMNK